ncbi:YbaK/EbsC family protein [Entomohabitans teleogrylli]|uniref:YbaK/EbsC family protein n=1 Tax=Entomohabitans teleogrylli TaxID=1384589 RepID=UPI00073D3F12|nr:YbaK/EbsC family protein [Entomohabitans teleogrylli]
MEKNEVLKLLTELNILYQYISHPEVKTVADHASFETEFPAQLLKNLLLKNSPGKHFYLYILDGNKKADLRGLARQLNESRLSFAKPDELMEILGVEAGGVTPFAIAHNKASDLRVVIDPSVSASQLLGFHPLVNTASVCIAKKDLLRLLAFYGYVPADTQTDGMPLLLARTTDAL